MVTVTEDGTPRVWDARTGKIIAELSGHRGYVLNVQFSPDSKQVVTASMDQTARVWEASTGKLAFELRGHTGIVNSAVYSPNGQYIATASGGIPLIPGDGTVRVWEASTGRSLMEQRAPIGVQIAAFSPDGMRILVSGYTESRIYACVVCGSLQDLVASAQARVTRELTCEERQAYLHENIVCPTPTSTPTSLSGLVPVATQTRTAMPRP